MAFCCLLNVIDQSFHCMSEAATITSQSSGHPPQVDFVDKNFDRPVGCIIVFLLYPKCDEQSLAMKITLNGEPREIAPNLSVTSLLENLELQSDRVAVEINLSILERSMYQSWVLTEGDRVEIISFIGGGAIAADYT